MYLLKINGQELAMPSTYTTVGQEINDEGTERNVMGTMIKNRVTIKKQITVTWNAVTKAEKDIIVTATGGNIFTVNEYYDCETDTMKNGTFYRGNDFEISPLLNYGGSSEGFRYYSLSMTLTEI